MAELGAVFDATEVDPQVPFEVIPSGKYVAQIVDSAMRATKDGTSEYLWLEFEITEGEYAGRKLWDRLNLFHPTEQTKQIAQRTLAAICHATDKLRISESEELHDIPLTLTVRVRPARDGYDVSNEIRGYRKIDAGAGQATAKPVVAARGAGFTGPWKRPSAA